MLTDRIRIDIFWKLLGGDVILREKHLVILLETLKPATPHWKTVGLALGFLDHELTIIECKPLLIPEGVTGYFRDMLSQWLRCMPSIHSCPTLETLVAVLRNAGEEKTAKILQEKYQLKSSKCISYFVSEVKAENWQSIYSLVATANLQYCIYSWKRIQSELAITEPALDCSLFSNRHCVHSSHCVHSRLLQ